MAATHRSRRMRAKADADAAAAAALRAGYQPSRQQYQMQHHHQQHQHHQMQQQQQQQQHNHHHQMQRQNNYQMQQQQQQQQQPYPNGGRRLQHFQTHFHNHQDSANLLSHPIYHLSIPPVNPVEGQFLNDEVDVYSIRSNSLYKYKLINELIENVVNKGIPFDKIIPPSSFPNISASEDVSMKLGEEERDNEEELIERLNEPKVNDYLFRSLKNIKLKERLTTEQVNQLTNEYDNINQTDSSLLISEKYDYQINKLSELNKLYSGYSISKHEDYNKLISDIEDDLKTKFNKVLKAESKVIFHSNDYFNEFRKSVSFGQYKLKKDSILKKKQELEKLKLKQEEELKLELLNEQLERERIQQQQQQQAQQQQQQQPMMIPPHMPVIPQQVPMQAQQQPSSQPQTVLHQQPPPAQQPITAQQQHQQHQQLPLHQQQQHPVPQQPVPQQGPPAVSFEDPFGSVSHPSNGNFEFDNQLLYVTNDELINIDDDNGFGSLDDQVFLNNLGDVNLE